MYYRGFFMDQQNEYPLWRLWNQNSDGTPMNTPTGFGESPVDVTKLIGITEPIYSAKPIDSTEGIILISECEAQ